MKKIMTIIIMCVFLSACSMNFDKTEDPVITEDVDIEQETEYIVESDSSILDTDESTLEENDTIEEIPVRSEETVNINDFTETEIKELKQRFFMQGESISVDTDIDEILISLIKTISLDTDLEDGEINIDDLKAFVDQTDVHFADTSDGYLVLTNKSLCLRFDDEPEETRLVDVDSTRDVYLDIETADALEDMFAQAMKDGIYLVLVSGYRDFDYQNMLFERKVASVGYEEANKVVARPGESEHQTGFVFDVTSASIGFTLVEDFDTTVEYEWLAENAANYGFILRYLEDKVDITGYSYEPWHYRYVGDVEIAQYITENHLTLEEYHELHMN